MRKVELQDERVEVRAAFEERGSVLAGTKAAACLGFEIELTLQSESTYEKLADLARQAQRMCFTDVTLKSVVPVELRAVLNGRDMESDPVD